MGKDKTARLTLPPEECAAFCEQAALILKSGLPLHDAVDALTDGFEGTRYAAGMATLAQKMKQSGSLYAGVQASGLFPMYASAMVRIGEAAGTLDRVMGMLAGYYERESNMRSSIRNAVMYPIVIIVLMAVVVSVLVSRVLPIFEQVFRSLGTEMSTSMTAVMNFGLTAGRVVLIFAAILALGTVVCVLLSRTRFKYKVREALFFVFPPARTIAKRTMAARLCSVFAMLLGAGFPVEEAANLAPDIAEDPQMQAKIVEMRDAMEAGKSFPQALTDTGVFPPVHIKMIQAGHMAGQTDRVMQRLEELYVQETDDSIRRLVALIEPSLVALLSIIIGGVLLAVMLPLASILSSMG